MLSNITAHMIEKRPLKHQIVRYASCLKPNALVLSAENKSSRLKFSKMLVKLTALNHISIKLADDAKEQFSKITDEHLPENREKFSLLAKYDQRLDIFMSQVVLKKEYELLWKVCVLVFCLSHGQSAVECGFKVNRVRCRKSIRRFIKMLTHHQRSSDIEKRSSKIHNHHSRYDQVSESCKRALQNISK